MNEINWFQLLSGFIGGLGLFIYGMKMMSEGLQKSAGSSLRMILEKLTSNRLIGTMVGTAVTAIIQSSSATTVMVVGFVNAGLMNLAQALSVILGANIGTTITAQLIAFKIKELALPAVGIGVIMLMFSHRKKAKNWGEILIGFGLIFLGLKIMGGSFVPLRSSQEFKDLFVFFSINPIMAAAAGALLTVIVQSSSATIGITIALASSGLLDFQAAAALVLGENIGTTITANLAAIGANRTAKQAAFGHMLFNFFGVCYMLVFLKFATGLVDSFTPGAADLVAADGSKPFIARHIANMHTAFNFINTLVFLPLLGVLAKVAEWVIKTEGAADEAYRLKHLDRRMLDTPSLAAAQARKETARMSDISIEMLKLSKKAFMDRDIKACQKIYKMEDTVDLLENDISKYLIELSARPLGDEGTAIVNSLQHVLHEIEKIADHAENIAKFTQKLIEKKIPISDTAKDEIEELFDAAIRFSENTLKVYNTKMHADYVDTNDENFIDSLRKQLKQGHMRRLNEGSCSVDAGIIYVDILNNLEKTGDHTFNIAQLTMGHGR